ncbi:DNA-binding transcriptional regulator, FrmR family [Desulfofundulus australicus DSM 11792]|jgi:DNA-binding FrmR family transcriptional regulator|uniref:DNA-binding transcriptional regulator, FrmR family n=1 Tax=Desulfofundulus australicus DSM 11792 TaxID=1121425 RepID=A0A1M4S997_9FIRM|nr:MULTISPECIES: metal-sensitive transcriptional regulator [Desulfofundulus]MDK2887272.1 CsoR family transcriptional regulator, copper-sensing transcriptional repressor [Thermoanaerobacter sp.]SHE28780.1 DNA-binding transcriptional regulator, FrmR family [Desulfofundulus australicus DSM 11792]
MGKDRIYRQEVQGDLLARLKRIEGQVRGVSRMIQEQRSCGEVVIQLAAIKAAISQVAMTTLACHLADELTEGLAEGKELKDIMADFMQIFRKFT